MTNLKTIHAARNPEFANLTFPELDAKLKAHLEAAPTASTAEALTEAKLDEFTAHAITTAELFVEFHLFRSEFTEAADFARDVAELKAEALAA